MNKYLWVSSLVVCAGLLFSMFIDTNKLLNLNAIATFDGKTITKENLPIIEDSPLIDIKRNMADIRKHNFAIYVENLLIESLISEFKIDASKENVLHFAEKRYGKLAMPGKAQEDALKYLYKALREVVEKKKSPKSVYETYFSDGASPFSKAISYDGWLGTLKIYGDIDVINALEKGLAKDQKATLAVYRRHYIEDTLKRLFCNQSEALIHIKDKFPKRTFSREESSIKRETEHQCMYVYYPWLFKQVKERVRVLDKDYDGYETYLSFYQTFKHLENNLAH